MKSVVVIFIHIFLYSFRFALRPSFWILRFTRRVYNSTDVCVPYVHVITRFFIPRRALTVRRKAEKKIVSGSRRRRRRRVPAAFYDDLSRTDRYRKWPFYHRRTHATMCAANARVRCDVLTLTRGAEPFIAEKTYTAVGRLLPQPGYELSDVRTDKSPR